MKIWRRTIRTPCSANWRRPLLLALLLVAGTCLAHQDRFLTMRPDGTIAEIPASFGTVSLKVNGLGSPMPKVRFSSGNRHNELPACITRLIRTRRLSDVSVSGSWYHDEAQLPYYVQVEFNDPGQLLAGPYRSNLGILFNLRTAQVIEVSRFVADPAGKGGRLKDAGLPAGCMGNDMRRTKPRPPQPVREPPRQR